MKYHKFSKWGKKYFMCLYVLFLMLLSTASGFIFGVDWGEGYAVVEAPDGYYREVYESPITVEDAREILAKSSYSHQYYVDRPELIMEYTPRSSMEHHMGCVQRYSQVWQLIIRLAEKSGEIPIASEWSLVSYD